MSLLKLLLFTGFVLLQSCATSQPKIQQVATPLPEKWETTTNPLAESSTQEAWWKGFNDPELNVLIAQALRSNNDVAAAAIRVRRAQLQASLIATNRTPSVAASVSTNLNHSFSPAATSKSSGVSGAVNYEPDLWGKLASQRNAAQLEAQAMEVDCQSFATALTITTARLYWQIAYFNQLISLGEDDIKYAQKTLAVVRAKHDAGAVSGLSTTQAELNLANLQASHTQLIQQRAEARHALAILFNQPPESVVAERHSLPETALPAIAAGLPASILTNRPDLNAAELRLRESLMHVDVTRTSFYPTISLTGSVGTVSDSLLNLLQNPVATLGAGAVLPFLQLNTMKLNVRVSKNIYEEAVVNFRQHLYTALAEVEDGLSARTQLMAEAEKLDAALSLAQHAESIAQVRYIAGLTEVQLWLDAQQSLRSTKRSQIANRYSQFINQANIYRALGLRADQNGSVTCNIKHD